MLFIKNSVSFEDQIFLNERVMVHSGSFSQQREGILYTSLSNHFLAFKVGRAGAAGHEM